MARSQVPKFGNWESEENVPYTVYFENARKVRKDGNMNPNDPEDNPDMSHNILSFQDIIGQEAESKGPEVARSKHERRANREDDDLIQRSAIDLHNQHQSGERFGSSKTELEAPKTSDALRQRHERHLSRDEGDTRPTDSTLHHDTVRGRANIDSPRHRHGGVSAGGTPKRVTRQGGPDCSIEHSPLHPHYQARLGGKNSGVSSPAWERKGSADGGHGLGSSTPGRSRLKTITHDDTPDDSPAVPKFGDWDENDPAAAEGYSHIFNKVREEKQTGAGKVPIMQTESSYSNGQKRPGNDNSKSCSCFPWGRK